jgi:hypothetical protein
LLALLALLAFLEGGFSFLNRAFSFISYLEREIAKKAKV